MSVGRPLAQMYIASQKPWHRAIERDWALVQKWLRSKHPKIKKQRNIKARNRCADENSLRLSYQSRRALPAQYWELTVAGEFRVARMDARLRFHALQPRDGRRHARSGDAERR